MLLLWILRYFGAFITSLSLDYVNKTVVRIGILVGNLDLGYWNCVCIWSAISLCNPRNALDCFFLSVDRNIPLKVISIDVVLFVRNSCWSIFTTFICLVLEFTYSLSVKWEIFRCSLLFSTGKFNIFVCLRCQPNNFTGNGGYSRVWFALKTIYITGGDAAIFFGVSLYMERLVAPVLGLVGFHKIFSALIFIATLLDHCSQLNDLILWADQLIGVFPGERWMFARTTSTFFVRILAIS